MLLAIETATAQGSIALIDSQGDVESIVLTEERNHGRSLALAVKELIGGRESQLQAYGVSIGPGSFTGLRIGLAFLKGFAIVYPAPVAPISTLEILAAGSSVTSSDLPVLTLLDARSREVYAGLYRYESGRWRTDSELPDGLYRQEDLFARFASTELIALGDGLVSSPRGEEPPAIPNTWKQLERELWWPQAEVLARLAWEKHLAKGTVDLVELEPEYHQLSAAERNFG